MANFYQYPKLSLKPGALYQVAFSSKVMQIIRVIGGWVQFNWLEGRPNTYYWSEELVSEWEVLWARKLVPLASHPYADVLCEECQTFCGQACWNQK